LICDGIAEIQRNVPVASKNGKNPAARKPRAVAHPVVLNRSKAGEPGRRPSDKFFYDRLTDRLDPEVKVFKERKRQMDEEFEELEPSA
jgi:hypothetical protein